MVACASRAPEKPAGAQGHPGLPAAEGRRVLLAEGPGGRGLAGSWQAGAAEGAVWQQLAVAGPLGPRGPCTRHGGCHPLLCLGKPQGRGAGWGGWAGGHGQIPLVQVAGTADACHQESMR